jgi:hypothetical protein
MFHWFYFAGQETLAVIVPTLVTTADDVLTRFSPMERKCYTDEVKLLARQCCTDEVELLLTEQHTI